MSLLWFSHVSALAKNQSITKRWPKLNKTIKYLTKSILYVAMVIAACCNSKKCLKNFVGMAFVKIINAVYAIDTAYDYIYIGMERIIEKISSWLR